MRTPLNLLSIITVLVAGASVLTVLASDFDARVFADPLNRVQLDSDPEPQQSFPKTTLRLAAVKDSNTQVRETLPATNLTVVPEVVRITRSQLVWTWLLWQSHG